MSSSLLAQHKIIQCLETRAVYSCGHQSYCHGDIDSQGKCSVELSHGPIVHHKALRCQSCRDGARMARERQYQGENSTLVQAVIFEKAPYTNFKTTNLNVAQLTATSPATTSESPNVKKSAPHTVTPCPPVEITPSFSKSEAMQAPKPRIKVQKLLERARQQTTLEKAQDIDRRKVLREKSEALRMQRAIQRQRYIEVDAKSKALHVFEASRPGPRFAVAPTSIPTPTLKDVRANMGKVAKETPTVSAGTPVVTVSNTKKAEAGVGEEEVWEDLCIDLADQLAEIEMEAEGDSDWVVL